MSRTDILILGGYGKAGTAIARKLLATRPDWPIQIAGHRRSAARERARSLRRDYPESDIGWMRVDATSAESVQSALEDAAILLVCTAFDDNGAMLVDVARRAGVDYIDINPDRGKLEALTRLEDRLVESGLRFVCDAGINPGCPSFLVRLVASTMDRIESATVASLYRDDDLAPGGARDMLVHAARTPQVYRDRRWTAASPIDLRRVDFGERFGPCLTVPVEVDELKSLPDSTAIESLELRQSGLNPVFDLLLLAGGALGIHRSSVGLESATRALVASSHLTRPPLGLALQVDATGILDDKRVRRQIRLVHDDLYEATAIPVVALIEQLRSGEIEAGWSYMGHAVEPRRFAAQLQQLGMKVEETQL